MTPKTDYGIYDPPALPVLPSGGGMFTDPTFGVSIMRLTDPSDGANYCRVQYSYWPTLNCDNTRAIFLTTDSSSAHFYAINQPAFTRGSKTIPTGDPGLDWTNGGYWHQTNPDVYYSLSGAKLYSYNVATNTFALVKDFTSSLVPNRRLYQPAMSDDRSVIAAVVRSTLDGSYKGVFAYNLTTNTVLKYDESFGARTNEVHLSGDGRYLTLDQDGPQDVTVFDLVGGGAGATIALSLDGPSHNTATAADLVSCTAFNTNQMAKWPLKSFVTGARTNLGPNWGFTVTGTLHLSALCANKDWVLVSCTDAEPGVSGAFHQELFLVSTTGNGAVYRFCHPRSFFAAYEDSTFANISTDGKFVAFSSNWGGSSRRDVFIVSIPNSPAAQNTPTPNPPDPIPPTLKKVAWPKQEGKQDQVIAEQWALGFRFKKNLTGDFAEFEKVT